MKYENISKLVDNMARAFESQGCVYPFDHSIEKSKQMLFGIDTSGFLIIESCPSRKVSSELIV